MLLRSRAPINENWRVLGIGVAVIVRVSTFVLSCRSFSLTDTPNFCSSSMIRSPRSLNTTSLLTIRCVPIRIFTLPSLTSFSTCLIWVVVRARLIYSIRQGKSLSLSLNVWKCWKASTVVGTSTATCLLSDTALKAARMATSVFPKPTSPQIRRSIGRWLSISAFTSAVAFIWSGVSS